jgi:pyrroline-5-carboxylate reductase
MLDEVKLGFIGGGNITSALVAGLRKRGTAASAILVSNPGEAKRERLTRRWQVGTTDDNKRVVGFADILVLAVKPQIMRQVCQPLAAATCQRRPLVVTLAAGLTTHQIDEWLGGGHAVVRAMPNTPSMVDLGAAALYANPHTSAEQCRQAQALMDAVGISEWLDDEAMMDVVTAVSGSGPAYFFLTIEILAEAATRAGLPSRIAHRLATQTAQGAGRLVMESKDDAATLRQRVTSEGGTTEQALNILQSGHIRELYQRAVDAAVARGQELARTMEDEQE